MTPFADGNDINDPKNKYPEERELIQLTQEIIDFLTPTDLIKVAECILSLERPTENNSNKDFFKEFVAAEVEWQANYRKLIKSLKKKGF